MYSCIALSPAPSPPLPTLPWWFPCAQQAEFCITSEAPGGVSGRLQSMAGLDGDMYLRGGGGAVATGVLNTGGWHALRHTHWDLMVHLQHLVVRLLGTRTVGNGVHPPKTLVSQHCQSNRCCSSPVWCCSWSCTPCPTLPPPPTPWWLPLPTLQPCNPVPAPPGQPVVRSLVTSALHWWVEEYQVDGFCFVNAENLAQVGGGGGG
jgi:hypothetical protein